MLLTKISHRFLNIRPGKKSDRDFVHRCILDVMHHTIGNTHKKEIPGFDECFDRILANPQKSPLFVAEENGKLIGLAACNKIETLETGCSSLSISDFYVVPDERGKKVGTRILNFLDDYARKNGIDSVELIQPKYEPKNTKGRTKFLSKNGFETLGPGRIKFLNDKLFR